MSKICDFIKQSIIEASIRHNVSQKTALDIAVSTISELSRKYGGGRHYIGNNGNLSRNMLILRDYRNGTHIDKLTKRYNVSRSTVYRIIFEFGGFRAST